MDETTRSLLLKARKGATASFEVKQWGIVLTALGCEYRVTKNRNTAVAVDIVTPGGKTITITKEPSYRRITFYKLHSALQDVGFFLVEMASAALGLESPEEEKRLKDLYVRDLTNTGTCPVCEGNFKRTNTGGLVHHGYQRPGDGYIYGDCFCVGYQPWELAPTGAEDYLKLALRPQLVKLEVKLGRLEAGEITTFTEKKRVRVTGFGHKDVFVEVTRETDAVRFEQLLADDIRQTKKLIDWTTQDIARFETKIAGWKLDVLPEIKYAGLFKVG